MGRRKIHIKKIEADRQRCITLSRRRAGLFKKAHELSVLCACEVMVIVFDSRDSCHTFASTQDTSALLQRYADHAAHGAVNTHIVDATGDFSEEIKIRNATSSSSLSSSSSFRAGGMAQASESLSSCGSSDQEDDKEAEVTSDVEMADDTEVEDDFTGRGGGMAGTPIPLDPTSTRRRLSRKRSMDVDISYSDAEESVKSHPSRNSRPASHLRSPRKNWKSQNS
ncbi:hypothetical protein HDV00_011110 [Rhizophlyctis rosea]|nr:hypothetical protein HDV00_011110 [Rhizophlyctis rosea]